MTREIETARLVLYPWRSTDLDEYARLLADPDVMRYITHEYGPLSYDEAKQAHARILRLWDERGFGAWAAVEKPSQKWVGKIGLDYLDRWPGADKIEVEWQLNRQFWGKGYATEGARAVIQYAFEELGLERIIAITVPHHAASRRIMEKCGLTYQGLVAVTDRRLHVPRDLVWYAIDRSGCESSRESWLPAAIFAALQSHPGIRTVRLAGSRAEGRAIEASDWDFVVEVDDFAVVAQDLPRLMRSLNPIAQLWDRLSDEACYMVILRGPVKVDLIFGGVLHRPEGPWEVTPDTLAAINDHFWDWTLWLTSKLARGRLDLVRTELVRMWEHILRPLGIMLAPLTVAQATSEYLAARKQWERRFQVFVSRDLEQAIVPRLPDRST